MGRTLDEMIDGLSPERQEHVEARYRELRVEVESLRELRLAAGKVQADIASALNIAQPSVSKIERQADMYLSTLRSYVQALGGELDLVVRLPSRPAMQLRHLGDVLDVPRSLERPARAAASARGKPTKVGRKRMSDGRR